MGYFLDLYFFHLLFYQIGQYRSSDGYENIRDFNVEFDKLPFQEENKKGLTSK